ncbi:MAG: NAD(P)-dependent oxidoreductase [Azospirillaceae bacterium]
MSTFRVALSGDFRKPDGRPAYPDFDLAPLTSNEAVEVVHVDPVGGHMPAEALEDIDALILLVPKFTAESVPKSGRLSVVARFGVGYDNVDLDACTANGIAAVITPDGVRRPVAVSVITFMLALAGRMRIKDRLCREGPDGWARRSEYMGMGVTGRVLGQLGIGNIGAEVFRMARPFDMTFIAHDPYADPALAKELGVELVSLEDLFRRSDFLSVSVPLNDETRGIVNAERLALMKPTAYVINTARGPIVDQKALTEALASGIIAGAGLDVFEVEPTPADEPLLAMDNVILAPHSLCWTDECFAGNGAADVRAVLDVMHGREPRGIVNRDVIGSDAFKARLDAYAKRFAG